MRRVHLTRAGCRFPSRRAAQESARCQTHSGGIELDTSADLIHPLRLGSNFQRLADRLTAVRSSLGTTGRRAIYAYVSRMKFLGIFASWKSHFNDELQRRVEKP